MPKIYQPIFLKAKRCVDVLIRSNEDNDFYLDIYTGAILYYDLNSDQESLDHLMKFIESHPNRFFMIPKKTEYEKRKIIEEFVHDKVSDIESSEKILQELDTLGYEDRFIEVLKDCPLEYDKWISFYSETTRIFFVKWINNIIKENNYDISFVLEEDLSQEFSREDVVELKENFEVASPSSRIISLRKKLSAFSKIYQQKEIMRPKPKRGRPPKKSANKQIEILDTPDIYIMYDHIVRQFVYYNHELSYVEHNTMVIPSDMIIRTPDSAIEQSMKSVGIV